MPACHKCGTELRPELDYGRQDTCPKCRACTRCCHNCAHYDPARYNECAEPVAERVLDKESSNFCDCFKPSDRKGGAGMTAISAARAAAEALFRKPEKK